MGSKELSKRRKRGRWTKEKLGIMSEERKKARKKDEANRKYNLKIVFEV
jgi:hypothetical protein